MLDFNGWNLENINNTRYYCKFSLEGEFYELTLNNLKFNNLINGNDQLELGTACASSASFSIYAPKVSLENKEIVIFAGIKTQKNIKYEQIGVYTIVEQKSDGEYVKYTGYDKMYLTDKTYYSELIFPSTDKKILEEICKQMGVQCDTAITNEHIITDKPEGYTVREMLGYMAMLQGGNAVINNKGNLEIRWYKEIDYKIDGHRYYQQGITFATSKNFIIKKIICNNTKQNEEESIITSGKGVTGLSLTNPFMTALNLDEVYEKIGGFTYRPLSVKFVGDFRLEVGDIVTVIKDGISYKVPVMQLQTECDGGLISIVESTAESETALENSATGPVTKNLERYYAALVTINKALVNKLDVETAKITYASITELNLVKGTVDNLKVNMLTVNTANLMYASIQRMAAVEATIQNLNVNDLKAQIAKIDTLIFGSASGSAIQTEFSNSVIAQLGDAQIKSAMIKDLSADKITGLDLNTTKLTVHSQDGKSIWKDNTILITDGTRARVQIGKDAAVDYNMYVWDKNGKLMFDALGLTADGITRQIIRDDVVMDNASISAQKLNIDSLFKVINEDGSNTLKASKVYVDADKQTLDVSFKNITTKTDTATLVANSANQQAYNNLKTLETITNTVTTQGTQLSAIQGQISSKIWKEDITKEVSQIQVGGRNLLKRSHKVAVTYTYPSAGYVDKKAWTTTIPLNGDTYTLSFWGKSTINGDKIRIHFYNPSNIISAIGSQGQKNNHLDGLCDFTLSTELTKYWVTYKIPKGGNSTRTAIIPRLVSGQGSGIVTIQWEKVEEGNKATDWTPAPEDVDDEIIILEGETTTLKTQYTTLNQSITSLSATVSSNTTAINKKADNSTVTSLQSNITSLQADLTGFKSTVSSTYATQSTLNAVNNKFAEYSTTAQMNSAIDQKANSITSTVSSTYATKTEVSKKSDKIYATFDGDGNTAAYCLLAEMKVTNTYVNSPIVIGIEQRGIGTSEIYIQFFNANNTDPGINTLTKIGNATVYIVKTATSTWQLYIKKSESYDYITVNKYNNYYSANKLTVTWKCTNAISVPSGYVEAKQLAAYYGVSTTNGGVSGSKDLTTSGALYSTTTIANQTANKFQWIVKSGTSATDFTITDRLASLTAQYINLNGLVTFNALDSAAQSKINGAVNNAENALNKANSATTNANNALVKSDTAINTANAAVGNAIKSILGNGTELNKDDNLDNCTEPGVYSSSDTDVVRSLQNAPNEIARSGEARLVVEDIGANFYKKQTLTLTYDGASNYYVFYRTGNSSVNKWSSWESSDSVIANLCYNQNKTYIDGGKIYTGTVTAAQIASNAITADKIATNAIKSKNYVSGQLGSFLNLVDGSFDSKNLKWNAQGVFEASAGKIGVFEITNGALKTEYTEVFSKTTTQDMERLTNIVTGKITPTESDYKDYDINRDGILSSLDMLWLKRIQNGLNKGNVVTTIKFFDERESGIIPISIHLTNPESSAGNLIEHETLISAMAVKTSVVNTTNLDVTSSATFADATFNKIVNLKGGLGAIKFHTIVVTTSENGNATLDLTTSYRVLAAWTNLYYQSGAAVIITPYFDASISSWAVHTTKDTTGEKLANQQLTVFCVTMENSLIGEYIN